MPNITDLIPEDAITVADTAEEAEQKELTRQIATACLEAKRAEQGQDVTFITEDEFRDFATKNADTFGLILA